MPGDAVPGGGPAGDEVGGNAPPEPFWRTKALRDMTHAEWESLCDGCGRCCLNKLEDWDTGAVALTRVACRLLDGETCRCKDYARRKEIVPECIQLTPDGVDDLGWLPPTCAYRLVAEGRDLEPWHWLRSGSRESVHEAGVSVRGWTLSESDVLVEDWEDHLIAWEMIDTEAGLKE